MKFEDFGYPSNEPCAVCGVPFGNRVEPRFLYSVCKDHYMMSPVEIVKEG